MRLAEHQHDCKGNHRVVVDGKEGEPAAYEHLAVVENGGKFFCAVTQYYEGDLPREMCEGVYELVRVGDDSKDCPAYNLFSESEECPWKDKEDYKNICTGKCPQKREEEKKEKTQEATGNG